MGNKSAQTPTFPDVMENFRKDLLYKLYCHLPGEVVAYDRTKNTAIVKVALKQVIPDYAAATGSKTAPYPQLTDVPVFLLQGGGASIGVDPVPGDACLICVLDRNIDAWYANGGQQAPLSPRAHSLSDAFCIVGFNPLPKPPTSSRAAGEAGIADALAKVVVMGGLVDVSNNAQNLKLILDSLIAQIISVNVGIAAESGTIPTAAAAATAANVQLALILARLAALLY